MGISLGAFLSNIGFLRVCVIISTVDLFVPLVLLYCKAISMEWMDVNVKFILTLVLCLPYRLHSTQIYMYRERRVMLHNSRPILQK